MGNHIVTKAAGVITGNASIDVTATLQTMFNTQLPLWHWRTDRAWDRNHDRQLMYENHVRLNHRHFIWAHDRNIPLCFSGSGSVCDFEQPGMGQYRKQLYQGTVCFGISGIFIMVCVGIYSVLVSGVAVAGNLHSALWSVAAYTVILCFSLFKTGSLSKSIFNAH